MTPAPLDQAALELAALYALSALAPDESAAVERDYRENAAFWAEVRSLRDAAAGLAESGPRARPRRDLWPAIQAALGASSGPAAAPGAQVWKAWTAAANPSSRPLGSDETPFEETAIPGIRVRRLFVDEGAGRVTMLIRMDPGTSYPAHRHGGLEECFVLQGDLRVGADVEMRAGDYQVMADGSSHPVQSTRGGCLLLLSSSQRDELTG